jgi:hypothetical protein
MSPTTSLAMRDKIPPSILAFRALVLKRAFPKEELNKDLIKRLLEISNHGLIDYAPPWLTL